MLTLPCYCSREDVMSAPDFAETPRISARVDRAIDSGARLIEGRLHRVFYPNDTTFKWDWPNFQFAFPWRLWFDQWDLVSATQVQSPQGTTIPLGNVIFRPVNRKPGWPYTYMEIDRSTSSVLAAGATPQLSIWITGTWGFTTDTDPAGTLAAAVSSTSATTVTVSDAAVAGVGDLLIVDSERMLVTDRALTSTGQSQVSGCSTASAADNLLTVTDGTKFAPGEVLLLDAERMRIDDITGNTLIVKRAWDSTIPAVHGGATIYAYRLLTVTRGVLGTTAATHSNGAALSRHRPPGLIRDLNLALALNRVLQETSGYARTVGEGDNLRPAPGAGLADLWAAAIATYGRKARKRAV